MPDIKPESGIEKRIIDSEEFKIASQYRLSGNGHKEKILGVHIYQVLDFIDQQPWDLYRGDLRTLALLHDLGKPRVVRNEKGGIEGNSHSQHSEEIARQFISNKDLLYCIRIHDKYIHFFKDDERGRFKEEKFVRTYSPADLELLTRFNYADSNNRERDSIVWFEDKCVKLGLKTSEIYKAEPAVLK
jgi:hypothetical protein